MSTLIQTRFYYMCICCSIQLIISHRRLCNNCCSVCLLSEYVICKRVTYTDMNMLQVTYRYYNFNNNNNNNSNGKGLILRITYCGHKGFYMNKKVFKSRYRFWKVY